MSTETKIDLMQFCAEEDNWWEFSTPFVQDGWLYATDGRMCVRVKAEDEPYTSKNVPKNTGGVFSRVEFASLPWPDPIPVFREVTCVICDGVERVNTTKCADCKGTGGVTCDSCNHFNDCRHCDGKGNVGGTPCDNCVTRDSGPIPTFVMIGSNGVRLDYHRKIKSLPGVQWTGNDATRITFSFDGGEGVVMKYLTN